MLPALVACNPSERAGPVASRDLPAAPSAFTSDRGLPPVIAGSSWEAIAAEQRAAAAEERRKRLGFVEWYANIRRRYRGSEGR